MTGQPETVAGRLTPGERRMIEQHVKVGGGISRKMAQQLLAEIDRLQRPDMDLAYEAGLEDGTLAARAEAFAEIRRGVEALAFEIPDEPSASSSLMARALVNRDEVLRLALLPSVPPDREMVSDADYDVFVPPEEK